MSDKQRKEVVAWLTPTCTSFQVAFTVDVVFCASIDDIPSEFLENPTAHQNCWSIEGHNDVTLQDTKAGARVMCATIVPADFKPEQSKTVDTLFVGRLTGSFFLPASVYDKPAPSPLPEQSRTSTIQRIKTKRKAGSGRCDDLCTSHLQSSQIIMPVQFCTSVQAIPIASIIKTDTHENCWGIKGFNDYVLLDMKTGCGIRCSTIAQASFRPSVPSNLDVVFVGRLVDGYFIPSDVCPDPAPSPLTMPLDTTAVPSSTSDVDKWDKC